MTRSILIFICLLAGAVAALYGQFLWNPIVFDDLPFFMVDGSGHQPVDDYRYSPFELRSLPYASLAWGKALFGLDMLHFRIENALLHAAVAVALFFFLARLFRQLLITSRLSPEALAFSAALLFALHPVAVYAAGYLVQRTMLMATLFSLLAMLAWLRGCEQGRSPWLWASVAFYYLAVFSKEHAILLPGVLLALTVLLHTDWKTRLRGYWPQWAGFVAVALFVVAAKKGVLGTAYEIYASDMLEDAGSGLNHPLSVLTQSWLFFKYAGLWLLPNPNWMSADMREPFAQSLWSGYLLAFMAFLAWGAIAVRLLFKRGRLGLLGFVLLFPWLMFLPEFSTIRIQESFVLYRSYLWAVGACALLPLLLQALDKRTAAVLVAAVALAMVPISMDRLASFSHPLMLWDDAAKLVEDKQALPGVYRIYYNRGSEFIKLGDYDSAISDLRTAARLYPEWPFAHSNLGSALLGKGEWRQAVPAFTEAIEIADRKRMGVNPKPYYGRAIAYENLGEHALARKDYELTCRLAQKGCEKLAN
jgi:tetratricopeptide (TPR) repeat protein